MSKIPKKVLKQLSEICHDSAIQVLRQFSWKDSKTGTYFFDYPPEEWDDYDRKRWDMVFQLSELIQQKINEV